MPTPIAAHFEDLRRRFPDESGPLITKAQQSFEAMEVLAVTQRPATCRSASFEIGGTDFLVWEMDDGGDRYQVFATTYNMPVGILRPSTNPSGMLVVDGFYIDLAKLAEEIVKSFQAAKISPEQLVNRKRQKIMLFGFCKSLGHHFWNEVSGLTSALLTGTFDTLDGVIVGPFDYFNLGPALKAKGKQVWKLNANGLIVTPDQLMIYRNNVVMEEARRLVIDNAALRATHNATPAHDNGKPTICFQIRRRWRPWIHEVEKLAEIIVATERAWPGTNFIIDGHSASQGTIAIWQQDIEDESEAFHNIQAKVGDIKLRSTIGVDLNEKINIFNNVDLFVGPIGSGGVLSSWLLRKPTLCYGPTSLYPLMQAQEHHVPEGGSKIIAVAPEHIQDLEGANFPFDTGVKPIFDLIQQEMQKIK